MPLFRLSSSKLRVIAIGLLICFLGFLSCILQSCFNDLNSLWQPLGKDPIKFFTLKNLWDCYYEWSAFGAGTPLMLENGDTVVQYYVPYLSAIQLYSNKSVATSRYV